jgi:hypothetical protein
MSKLKVFTDESCLNDQFLGYGGVFIKEEFYDELEGLLEDFAKKNGFEGREFSYKKCRQPVIDRYIGFISVFFNYLIAKYKAGNGWVADFRSLIINTQTNPIQLTEKSWEEGFYKFYFHFITRSLFNITNSYNTEFELNIADKTDSYQFRTEVMQITTSGALKGHYGEKCTLNEIKRDNPKQSRVHQLADVLLGCVTYRFNNKSNENKEELIQFFEKTIRTKLNIDFKPNNRPINVWGWTSKGQKRWVEGANGVVGF